MVVSRRRQWLVRWEKKKEKMKRRLVRSLKREHRVCVFFLFFDDSIRDMDQREFCN
jgi:hypothetical protein